MKTWMVAGVVLALASPALAQVGRAPARDRGERRGEVTLDVRDAPLGEVVEEVRERAGVALFVAPHLEGERVTLRLREADWRVAAAVLARLGRCRLRELEGGALLLDRPPTVSVRLVDADLRQAILLLCRVGGANVVIGPEVRGRVTLELNDVEWRAALEALVRTSGDYTVVDDSGPLDGER